MGIGLGYEGNRLVAQVPESGDLSQQHYILRNLVKLVVRLRWVP